MRQVTITTVLLVLTGLAIILTALTESLIAASALLVVCAVSGGWLIVQAEWRGVRDLLVLAQKWLVVKGVGRWI